MTIFTVHGEVIICKGYGSGSWYTEEYVFVLNDAGIEDVNAEIEKRTLTLANNAHTHDADTALIAMSGHWEDDDDDEEDNS